MARSSITEGDDVIVAGNPEGLAGTFSRGIVSAVRKSDDLLQIDAPISPGSSGGPVVNLDAEVVGVATSSLVYGQNLNFVVPLTGHAIASAFDADVAAAGVLAVSDRRADGYAGAVERVDSQYWGIKPDTSLKSRMRQEYDALGNRTFDGFYKPDGISVIENVRSFDAAGVLQMWRTRLQADAEPRGSKYDRSAGLDKMVSTRLGVPEAYDVPDSGHYRVRYDSHCRKVSEVITTRTAELRSEYSYDDRGFPSRTLTYDGSRLVWEHDFEYETDARGNWTTQREIIRFGSDGGISEIWATLRSIDYRD